MSLCLGTFTHHRKIIFNCTYLYSVAGRPWAHRKAGGRESSSSIKRRDQWEQIHCMEWKLGLRWVSKQLAEQLEGVETQKGTCWASGHGLALTSAHWLEFLLRWTLWPAWTDAVEVSVSCCRKKDNLCHHYHVSEPPRFYICVCACTNTHLCMFCSLQAFYSAVPIDSTLDCRGSRLAVRQSNLAVS